MEDKYKYYSYAIIFLNIIIFSLILNSLKGYLLIVESIIFFAVFFFSLYLMYSLEKGNLLEKLFLIFFAILTINALIIFIFTHNIYSIAISILNLIGLYLVVFSISEKTDIFSNTKKDSNNDETDYNLGKSSELNKSYEKEKFKQSENTHYLPNEEHDIKDDLLDESEIVIEEIKPIPDTSKEKKGKRNKPRNKQ